MAQFPVLLQVEKFLVLAMGYRGVLVDIHMHTRKFSYNTAYYALIVVVQKACLKNSLISEEKKIVKYLSKHLLEKMSLRKLCLKQIHFRIKIRNSVSTESK